TLDLADELVRFFIRVELRDVRRRDEGTSLDSTLMKNRTSSSARSSVSSGGKGERSRRMRAITRARREGSMLTHRHAAGRVATNRPSNHQITLARSPGSAYIY